MKHIKLFESFAEKSPKVKQFMKDLEKTIQSGRGFESEPGFITIYLDDNSDEEEKLVKNLVREKYSEMLKKVASEDDVLKYKILK